MFKQDYLQKIIFKRSVKFWLVVLFVLPAIPFLVVTLGLLIFSYFPWPINFDVEAPELKAETEKLIVLIHGMGDSPATWPLPFAKDLEKLVLDENQEVITVDWHKYSTNIFRCSNNGRRLGQQLGQVIAQNKQLKRVHLIGHSAGSFVAYGLCESLKNTNPDVFVHTSYLSPLAVYSGFQWRFGTNNFGSCADLSNAYIDKHDTVPGSSIPLKNAHTFEVSALRLADSSYQGSPHFWPIEFYRQQILSKNAPFWDENKDINMRYATQSKTVLSPSKIEQKIH